MATDVTSEAAAPASVGDTINVRSDPMAPELTPEEAAAKSSSGDLISVVCNSIIGTAEHGLLDSSVAPYVPTDEEVLHLRDKLLGCSPNDNEIRPAETQNAERFFMSPDGHMFVRAALVQQNGVMERAEHVCRGFMKFRHSESWPYRIKFQDVSTALRTGFHVFLPRLLFSRAGHPLLIYDTRHLDTSLCPMETYQKMTCFLLEGMIYANTWSTSKSNDVDVDVSEGLKEHTAEHLHQFDGIIYLVIDARTFGIFDLARFSLNDLFRGMGMLQDTFPIKPRKIFLLNSSWILSPLLSIVYVSMSKKLQERIVLVDDDLSQLHDEVALENLPPSLGGTCCIDWQGHIDHMHAAEENDSARGA